MVWVACDTKASWVAERFLDSSTPHRGGLRPSTRQTVSSHDLDQRAWASHLAPRRTFEPAIMKQPRSGPVRTAIGVGQERSALHAHHGGGHRGALGWCRRFREWRLGAGDCHALRLWRLRYESEARSWLHHERRATIARRPSSEHVFVRLWPHEPGPSWSGTVLPVLWADVSVTLSVRIPLVVECSPGRLLFGPDTTALVGYRIGADAADSERCPRYGPVTSPSKDPRLP